MNHFIKDIAIQNFKSIQNIEIKDCSRINIFIGEPNVGKSNILEALAITGLPHNHNINNQYLKESVRPHNTMDLFYNGNFSNEVEISISNYKEKRIIIQSLANNLFQLSIGHAHFRSLQEEGYIFSFNNKNLYDGIDIKVKEELSIIFPIKKYHFIHNFAYENVIESHLISPFGKNLPYILAQNKFLMKDIQELFTKYGQKLVLDRSDNSIRVLKNTELEDSFVFLIPYSSVADSLQRLIFYKAAVASNKNAILLFEEPEAHTFPPYISKLTHDIIQSATNQFFITTHSPVIVNDFMENAQEDLSVFIVDFKNNQTVVHKLTPEEIHRVYQYGIDLFYNYESFIDA